MKKASSRFISKKIRGTFLSTFWEVNGVSHQAALITYETINVLMMLETSCLLFLNVLLAEKYALEDSSIACCVPL